MIVEKIKTEYTTYAEKYLVYTVGTTLEGLKAKMLEAINLYFEKQDKTIIETDLKLSLDLPQFFEFYNVINAKGTFRTHRHEPKPFGAIY
ncbi:MAG: hypothetical protein V5804_05900 [Mucilaginibacter sp.]|uniref:hypothetical protein n=1 Tax=Mucilaginibacter sp. TaxID=1882438 RepID=UPI0034E52B32